MQSIRSGFLHNEMYAGRCPGSMQIEDVQIRDVAEIVAEGIK